MKKWKVIVGILLIFMLGCFTGGLVTHRRYHRIITQFTSGPAGAREGMMRMLTRRLHLTLAQQVEVDNAIHDAQRDFAAVRKEVQPRVEGILDRAQERIRKQLDVGQREKFDRIIEQHKSRWQNPQVD